MLLIIFALGLAGFYTTEFVRKLPYVENWTLLGKRPWACNVCMSAWTTFLWWAVLHGAHGPLAAFAGAGIALGLLHWSDHLVPPTPPPL